MRISSLRYDFALPMIRDDLALAVRRALADAGAARAARRHRARPAQAAGPRRLGHARRPRAAEGRRREPAATSPSGSRPRSRPPTCRTWPGSRSPSPASSTSILAPTWLHDVLRDGRRRGRHATGRSDALAGQRINLEFVSANPTGPLHAGRRALGRGRRRDREPARGPGRRRCTASTTSTTPAPSSTTFRDSLYARYRGEQPPEDGYQGQYLVDMARAAARRARRRRRRPTTRASGATARSSTGSAGRSRPHRRALRHLVLGAHAARARRRRRRARASSTSGGVRLRATTARAGCARPTSATQRDRVLVRSRRHHDVSLQRPRVPPRQVRAAASRTSSTSGAPTTTAR